MQYTQQLIGNLSVQRYLQNMIKSGIVPHAQLWVGPAHVGKRTFLVNFIIERMCSKRYETGAACLRCANCRLFKHDAYPLLRWLDAEDLTMTEVKSIIADSALTQLVAGHRWLVIEHANELSPAVSNALLKLLEEPRTDITIILLTQDDEDILPTVRSRCSVIRFQTVPANKLLEQFPQASEAMTLSHGLPGLAHSLTQSAFRKRQEQLLEDCRVVVKASAVDRLAWLTKLYPDKKTADLTTVLNALELALYEQRNQAHTVAGLRHIQSSRKQLQQNGQPKLVLTNLLLNLPQSI